MVSMVPTLQKFLLSQQIASHQLNSTLPGGTAGYPAHHLPELIYGFEKINIEFYFWTKHCTRKNSSVIPILYPPRAGIGKLPALAGRYFGILVSVLLWVFLTVRFGRENLLKILRELFF